MSKHHTFIVGLCCLFSSFILQAQQIGKRTRIKPVEIDAVLNNPGIGFTTFQRFNGDKLNEGTGWTEGLPIVYQKFDGNLINENHPQTTIAYFRVDWAFLEPEEGKYDWPMIDKALKTAAARGQTLMLRIAPYEEGDRDVPAWYRKMVGREEKLVSPKWQTNPEDPRYLKYYGGMIRALGERYDGHPALESVDIAINGFWGEGDGSHLLSESTRVALINCYLDNFKRTPLTFQPLNGDAPDPGILVRGTNIEASWPDGRNNGVGINMRQVGIRCDCLGDMTTDIWTEQQWSHMGDVYPRDIVKSGMAEAWRKEPVTMEICGTFLSWRDSQKYDIKTVEYIFNESLKWHISSFNAKSSPVPKEWQPLVNKWLNKMGYRYVVRRFEYPTVVKQSGQLALTSLWENVGVAPLYKDYKLAIRIKNTQRTELFLTKANLLHWLPGDIVFEEQLYIPYNTPPGKYRIEIALVSPVTLLPAVKLAIAGITEDGWYSMGDIWVEK